MVFCKTVNNEEKKEKKQTGFMVVQWVAPSLHNENVRPLPAGAFLGGVLHVLPVPVWVLCKYSSFLSQSTDMRARLIADSTLTVSVTGQSLCDSPETADLSC